MSTGPEHDVFLVPSQYSSIQEAIGAIVRPSTIMVSPGVYNEEKSMIAGNNAQRCDGSACGGGLYLVDCDVEIAGSSIQANAVYGSVEARGGGIYCERSQVRMWRSRVTDNALYGTQCEGAGIYFRDSSAQLGGSVVTGNGIADGRGGGIFVSGHSERVVVHRNTVVRQNHPDDYTTE